jgi:predicted ester cyclase
MRWLIAYGSPLTLTQKLKNYGSQPKRGLLSLNNSIMRTLPSLSLLAKSLAHRILPITPDPIVGLKANKEFSKGLFEGFPSIRNTIGDVVAEGDTVIIRSTLEGKQTGSFLGIPATNKTAKMNDFTLYKIRNGKISEMWYETNLMSLMQQLGVAPELK